MHKKNNVPIVVCSGLTILRCLADSDQPIVVASHDPEEIAFHSKYCHRKFIMADPARFPQEALQDLVSLGETFSEKPVLYYGNDILLLFISRNRAVLSLYYRFSLPHLELLEDLTSKPLFALFSKRMSLPIPKTVLSRDIQTADDIMRELSFPCIFKPHSHIGWAESAIVQERLTKPYKAIKAENPDQLHHVYNRLKAFTTDFVIQEYIEGEEDQIYSFHAYLNHQSEPLAYYVGQKIRTYPMHAGESTFIELINEPMIVDIGMDILKRIKFVGVVKIDFKKDAMRNRFYVLELNARYNLWNYLGAHCGINLPLLAYYDMTGAAHPPLQRDYKTGVRWLSFVNDVHAFYDMRDHGKLSVIGWLSSYLSPKVYDVFSWKDPLPFLIDFTKHIGKYLYKKIRQLCHIPMRVHAR